MSKLLGWFGAERCSGHAGANRARSRGNAASAVTLGLRALAAAQRSYHL